MRRGRGKVRGVEGKEKDGNERSEREGVEGGHHLQAVRPSCHLQLHLMKYK